VRTPRKVKEEFEKASIKVNKAVRRYLEELARRVKAERVLEQLNRLLDEATSRLRLGLQLKSGGIVIDVDTSAVVTG